MQANNQKRIAEEQEAQRLESERIAKEKSSLKQTKKALDEQRIALEKRLIEWSCKNKKLQNNFIQ